MNKLDLISYAGSFVSFISNKLSRPVKEIMLFGSVARGDFTKESDVDIFINVFNEEDVESIKRDVAILEKKFYKSQVVEQWRLKGIENVIKVKVGVLEKWALKRSVISDGIILYGKYRELPKGEGFVLLSFEPIKDVTKRNRVMRVFFGRGSKEGIIAKVRGRRLAPTVLVVRSQLVDEVLAILKKEKIDYRVFELWSDQF